MNIENALDWNRILGTVIPIYFVIFLGYASVRWWKILTPEQCNGINKYVAEIAFPFLVLEMLMTTNLYNTNFLVIAADSVQKIFILVILFLLKFVIKGFTFEWLVTLFMISAFTNNVAIGIPLIGSIYGEGLTPLLIQILVFQSIIWFNLALFMYEYISAKQQVIDNKVENEIPLSAEISSIDPNNIGLVYPEKIVAHESIDVDVKIDHSEPSLQQQTTPTSLVSHIIQATFPALILSFVIAKHHNVYPEAVSNL
ncbi:unnamed protein product [Lupinus luteus]|uniref:PIN-like protein n=1 Tax=Lupinus luteus TaxID=3873 RepID=A0AAV1WM26_LUPLU